MNNNALRGAWGMMLESDARHHFAKPLGNLVGLVDLMVMGAILKVNVYRIDLNAVITRYIGETEKNLNQLLDGAQRGNVVLLFDEADALFGKRTVVRDSHDRYANVTTSYLMTRINAAAGVVWIPPHADQRLKWWLVPHHVPWDEIHRRLLRYPRP